MLFQSLASILVGLECILRFTPDIYCDTMGAAFTYPAAYYLTGAKIIAYVHYPIISTVSSQLCGSLNEVELHRLSVSHVLVFVRTC